MSAEPGSGITTSATLQAAATGDGVGTVFSIAGYPQVSVQVVGTLGTATITFQGTIDGTNYVSVAGYPAAGGSGVTSVTSAGVWYIPTGGLVSLRAAITGSGGGTNVTVTARAVSSASASGGGGGGGGGGAVTSIDGGLVTLGANADAAVGDATGTVNAHARQIAKSLAGSLTVIQGTAANLKVQAASTVTANYTDSVSVIAAQVLARAGNAPLRGTWDLRTAKGGWLMVRIGRGGTTALAAIGAEVLIRRVIGNGAAGGVHPAGITLVSGITAATSTTVGTDSASGQNVLNATLGTGFLADQIICIQDAGGGVTRLEWARISKVSSNTIYLDHNLDYTHTSAQADTIRNLADVFNPVWLDGGSLWEVIIDYGQQSAGESITVQAIGQLYASDTYQ